MVDRFGREALDEKTGQIRRSSASPFGDTFRFFSTSRALYFLFFHPLVGLRSILSNLSLYFFEETLRIFCAQNLASLPSGHQTPSNK